jgi:hypothetical protein
MPILKVSSRSGLGIGDLEQFLTSTRAELQAAHVQ